MADISKCTDNQCPSNTDCHRFTAISNPYRQAYGGFCHDKKEGKCVMFWPNGEYKMTKESHKQAKQELGFPMNEERTR